MNYRSGIITGAVGALLLVAAAYLAWYLASPRPAGPGATASTPPAKVSKVAKEDDFATITLTADAEKRLNIQTAAVASKGVRRVRVLGGEVVIPPGGSLIVSSPVAGILKPPAEGRMPVAGASIKKDQMVMQISPLLTPEAMATLASSRVDSEGQVKSASEQKKATRIALDRARRLYKEQAGSKRNVDEAEAQFLIASEAVKAARARLDLLTRVVGDLEKGTVAPIPVHAPEEGMLRTISAVPGQTVPSGAVLFEIIDPRRVWVRLGVYVGDLAGLATGEEVRIGDLSDTPGEPPCRARPVLAPPSANPLAATVDLFYAMNNRAGLLRPGERVGVHIPLREAESSLVVPWSAVIHDYHGGAWVYEKVADHVYTRRRVRVRHVSGDSAVLDAGPSAGARVVTVGAAELFGTEVGFSK